MVMPPLLFFAGAVVSAIATYDGTCPGVMDIPPYPCSLLDYIGRNTSSPFALVVHITVSLLWGGFALGVLLLGALVRRLLRRADDRRA
ncbi:MAG: hypothetical protein ACLFVO_26905 [Chloroflexaceae bacterium]